MLKYSNSIIEQTNDNANKLKSLFSGKTYESQTSTEDPLLSADSLRRSLKDCFSRSRSPRKIAIDIFRPD